MTILLTGGTGFLGSHVAEQLSEAGRKVRALVRKSSDTRFLRTLSNVELVEGAVDDAASMLAAARGVDSIVHAAGLVKARSPDEFLEVNAEGTLNALSAARKNAVRRFVYVSSLAAAGPSDADGNPVPATATPRPVTHYGKSKLAAEAHVHAARDELEVIVLRPAAIYGPRDREILAFFKAIKVGVLPYMGSTENKLSMIYGADCARACVAALDATVPSGSSYFLDDGRVYRFADLIANVETAMGTRAWLRFPLPRRVIHVAGLASELYGRATNRAVMLTRDKCNELFAQWVCDSSDAQQKLGWRPSVPFEEGARLTVDWYRGAGWL
jgi:nucleoside-diphosphate-sugar epimerase